jgi:type II secretory pathway pseudopilin PulG
MQRKNNILNTSYIKHTKRSSRSGIAMIMAIAVIVILATIMALSLALTSQTTKRSTDLYLYEQAILLSKSATEYALLRISQDGECVNHNLDFSPPSPLDYYDINITVWYVYTSPSPCAADRNYTTVTTPEQNGSVLMDVSVSVNDTTIATEPIRFFKRTIEKL